MWKKYHFFVEKTPPTGLIEYLYMFYVYDGDCASTAAQEQAKTNFDTNLGICGADCKKGEIKVYCGAASTVARRKRRSVKQLSVRMTIKITRSKAEALQVCCLGLNFHENVPAIFSTHIIQNLNSFCALHETNFDKERDTLVLKIE